MDAFFTQVGLWAVAQGGGWLVAGITGIALWRVADILYKTQEKRADEGKTSTQAMADVAKALEGLREAVDNLREIINATRGGRR